MNIALFGTSADPPTLAHRAILVWLAQHYDRVAVWAADNPFKQVGNGQGGHHASLRQRQTMLKLLVQELGQNHHNLQIWDDLSDRRSLISVRRAQQKWGPEARYSLVVGSDLIDQIPRWYEVKTLLQTVELIIFPRPGYEPNPVGLQKLQVLGGRYQLLSDDRGQPLTPAISSSGYRQCPDTQLLPPTVAQYIQQQGLYSS